MKIPLIYIPKTRYKKFLYIEKKYKSSKTIIPVGCDCHPAYTLQKLNIRKYSLPFDWLNTDPVLGLLYVYQNIRDGFVDFLSDLERNERGHVVSKKYPYAEFMHEKNLIDNPIDQEKLKRRIRRFKGVLEKETVFLYKVKNESLDSKTTLEFFYNSVIRFIKLMKTGQFLCIYISYFENQDVDNKYSDELINRVRRVDNVAITKYLIREKDDQTWGNENKYPQLFRSLGIQIKQTLPRVYIK